MSSTQKLEQPTIAVQYDQLFKSNSRSSSFRENLILTREREIEQGKRRDGMISFIAEETLTLDVFAMGIDHARNELRVEVDIFSFVRVCEFTLPLLPPHLHSNIEKQQQQQLDKSAGRENGKENAGTKREKKMKS